MAVEMADAGIAGKRISGKYGKVFYKEEIGL